MAAPLDLSNVSPDVKRLVLGMVENSIEEVRKISPSWNRIAIEYLADRRNKLPLERVLLQSSVLPWDYTAYAAQDAEMQRANSEAIQLLHMYAIIPDRCRGRVGVGKWLKTHQTFQGDIEVNCAPQKIALTTRERMKLIAIEAALLLVLGTVSWAILLLSQFLTDCNLVVWLLCFSTFFIFIALRRRIYRNGSELDARRLARLSRFFSSFSDIQLVVFDTFSDLSIFNKVTLTLGNINIDKIEVRMVTCDKEIMNRVVDLTRKHGIKRVSIIVAKCDQGRLRDFFIKLAQLGATVNIYEYAANTSTFYEDVISYFHRQVEFWDKMAADLERDGVSLTLSTIKDDNFVNMRCASYVRTHLACMPSHFVRSHDDTERHRGFYRVK